MSLPRPGVTHLGLGPWAFSPPPSGHLASYKRKSRFENLLSDSGSIEAFVWWTPAMLWRSGLLVLLAVNKEGLDQIPKWQSRPAGEQPSADISSGQPHSKLRSPPKNQQDKPLVGSFTLATGICSRLISRHKACCIDRTASLVCQSAACQGIVSRRVPEGSRLTPPTGCGVSPWRTSNLLSQISHTHKEMASNQRHGGETASSPPRKQCLTLPFFETNER